MDSILEMLMVVDWLANDLHYQFKGEGFYENHLLADRVRNFGSAEDDLKEVYFLGQLGTTPPLDKAVSARAADKYDKICVGNPSLLARLHCALDALAHQVEAEKNGAFLAAGVHAVLDEISRRALAYRFLVSSQMHREVDEP